MCPIRPNVGHRHWMWRASCGQQQRRGRFGADRGECWTCARPRARSPGGRTPQNGAGCKANILFAVEFPHVDLVQGRACSELDEGRDKRMVSMRHGRGTKLVRWRASVTIGTGATAMVDRSSHRMDDPYDFGGAWRCSGPALSKHKRALRGSELGLGGEFKHDVER